MNSFLDQLTAQTTRTTSSTTEGGSEILDTIVTSLDVFKNLILAIVIIVVFYVLGKIIAARIVRSLQKAKGETLYPDMVALVNRFSVFGALSIGIAAVLQFIFELDFIQVISFFGLGISFAFKDLLENLIAGAVVILQNRFRVGDFIQIGAGAGGIKGKIMEIQTRCTILKSIDGTEIVVPNSELMTKSVVSFTAHHTRRINFAVDVDLDTDLKKAMSLATEIIQRKPHVLKNPRPRVLVSRVSGSSMKLNIRFWVDPQNKEKSWVITKSELMAEIKEEFDKAGILIPYPVFSYLENKRTVEKAAPEAMEQQELPEPLTEPPLNPELQSNPVVSS
ncbi:MAG: mechanosensitive ion channel family protein [Candidatus Altimarinota bacterium]